MPPHPTSSILFQCQLPRLLSTLRIQRQLFIFAIDAIVSGTVIGWGIFFYDGTQRQSFAPGCHVGFLINRMSAEFWLEKATNRITR